MRIFCWNINGLTPTAANVKLKHGSLKKFFSDELQADIVCFQETKLTSENIRSTKATLTEEVVLVDGCQSFWACSRARAGYSGVATWATTEWAPVDCQVDCLGGGEADIDQEGRVAITDHGAFVLLNVYAPNAGDRPARARLPYKLRFLEALKEKMDLLVGQGREVILVGDLNIAATTQDVHQDIDFKTLYSEEELAIIRSLFEDYVDVWRARHPGVDNIFSVWTERTANRLINKGLRMDYAVVSKGLMPFVTSCEIPQNLPPKWSDHAPVVLELQGLAPPAPQPAPCAAWKQLLRRFRDPAQRSLASMWAAKANKPAAGASTGCEGSGAAAAAVTATAKDGTDDAAPPFQQAVRSIRAAAPPAAATVASAVVPAAAASGVAVAGPSTAQQPSPATHEHVVTETVEQTRQHSSHGTTSSAAEAAATAVVSVAEANHTNQQPSAGPSAASAASAKTQRGKRRQQPQEQEAKKQKLHPFFARLATKPP